MSGETDGPGGERICESCAAGDDDLVAVHRVYLIAARGDIPASATVVADVELWCVPCRTMYPHVVTDQP